MGWFDDGIADITKGQETVTSGGLNYFADPAMGEISGLIPGSKAAREAQERYMQQLAALQDRIEKEWKLPVYDQTPLTPEEYTLLAHFNPQYAAFVQQEAPQLLRNVPNAGTRAQQQALDQLSTLSKTGVDEGMKAQLESANMSADQAMRSRRANALADLSQRGLGSSGATLGADLGVGLVAGEQQRQMALEAAKEAALRKSQAIEGLGTLGTQVAGQEQQKSEFNANTLNEYNRLLANRQQQYQDYLANTRNNADLYNQQAAQNIANMNTGVRNTANEYNKNREDRIAQSTADFNDRKLQALAGLQGGAAKDQLGFDMQRANDQTKLFMSGLAIGGGALMGGGPGAMTGFMANQGAPNSLSQSQGENNYLSGGGYVTDWDKTPMPSDTGAIYG